MFLTCNLTSLKVSVDPTVSETSPRCLRCLLQTRKTVDYFIKTLNQEKIKFNRRYLELLRRESPLSLGFLLSGGVWKKTELKTCKWSTQIGKKISTCHSIQYPFLFNFTLRKLDLKSQYLSRSNIITPSFFLRSFYRICKHLKKHNVINTDLEIWIKWPVLFARGTLSRKQTRKKQSNHSKPENLHLGSKFSCHWWEVAIERTQMDVLKWTDRWSGQEKIWPL